MVLKRTRPGTIPTWYFSAPPGTKLELYPLDLLAKDIDPGNPPAPGSGFGGITLAYNAITKEEVVEI
nr:lactoylglutathione lyase [Akkermansia muciniphila]